MPARRAGQYVREMTRRKALLALLALATMFTVAGLLVLVGSLSWRGLVAVELLLLAGVVVIDRRVVPVVERWARGAAAEEHAGELLAELEGAQRIWLERVAGRPATALLVLSRAYLVGRAVSRQRGVVVLPARMLAGYLRRSRPTLSAGDARELHDRLRHALAQADAPG